MWGFRADSAIRSSPAKAGDVGSTLGLGRFLDGATVSCPASEPGMSSKAVEQLRPWPPSPRSTAPGEGRTTGTPHSVQPGLTHPPTPSPSSASTAPGTPSGLPPMLRATAELLG